MATFRPHFSRLTEPGRRWHFVFRAGITVVAGGGIPFCYCCCCCCLLLLLSVVVVWDYGVSNQRIFTFGQVWRICSGRDYWTPRSAWGLERERRDGGRWLCHIHCIRICILYNCNKIQITNIQPDGLRGRDGTVWDDYCTLPEMILPYTNTLMRWFCEIQIQR